MNNDLILFRKTDYYYDIDMEFYNLSKDDFYDKFNNYFVNGLVD